MQIGLVVWEEKLHTHSDTYIHTHGIYLVNAALSIRVTLNIKPYSQVLMMMMMMMIIIIIIIIIAHPN